MIPIPKCHSCNGDLALFSVKHSKIRVEMKSVRRFRGLSLRSDARYSPRWFSIIVETSPLSFPFIASQADILALWGQSKILGHCWDVLKVVTCLQSSLWASPHRPTQCSKTSLKMSNWKCEILTEPSNGQESYFGPREQGYLFPGR